MEQITLGEVINGGIGVILLFLLVREQQARKDERKELNALIDRLFSYLEEARRVRHRMANKQGVDVLAADIEEQRGGD